RSEDVVAESEHSWPSKRNGSPFGSRPKPSLHGSDSRWTGYATPRRLREGGWWCVLLFARSSDAALSSSREEQLVFCSGGCIAVLKGTPVLTSLPERA